MILLTKDRVEDILHYMEDDLANCLYLYGDIVRYGVDDPHMAVWFSEKDGAIRAVLMKYFTGAHIYSKELDFDLEEVSEKLKEILVDRISSQRKVIEALYPLMREEFDVEYGGVFRLTSYREMESPVAIERAEPSDAEAIAELLMTHEMYGETYQKEALAEELANRMETGIGRSYIMREGNRIIAHDGINLETDTYAIAGLALVHDAYRNTLYGSFLDSYMINDLGKEGKDLYCMILEGRRLEGFIKIGNRMLAEYGKLVRKGLREEES